MRLLACDPRHKYFFLGVTQKELEEQVIPLQQSILEEYGNDLHPHLLISSEETRDQEIENQKLIKKNPFTRRTRLYSVYIHEAPEWDAYIVTNPSLTELYFVPFDFFFPHRWGSEGAWSEVDKKDIKSLAELCDAPFTHKGGVPYHREWHYTKGEAAELLSDLLEKLPSWKEKGPKKVLSMVMPHFQGYRLYYEEMEELLIKGGVKKSGEWWDQDQMHLKIADYDSGYRDPLVYGKRSLEEEDAHLNEMEEQGHGDAEIVEEVFFDYLDGIISWDTVYSFYGEYPPYQELNKMKDDDRRRYMWLKRYDPDGCPF